MSMMTSAAISGYREYTKRTVSYARFKAGGTWYTSKILDVSITSAGVVEVAFKIEASVVGATTITQVQLYDTAGVLWAEKTESLSMGSVAEGFTYVFKVTIEEQEVNR